MEGFEIKCINIKISQTYHRAHSCIVGIATDKITEATNISRASPVIFYREAHFQKHATTKPSTVNAPEKKHLISKPSPIYAIKLYFS
jgi:hypothetical protein